MEIFSKGRGGLNYYNYVPNYPGNIYYYIPDNNYRVIYPMNGHYAYPPCFYLYNYPFNVPPYLYFENRGYQVGSRANSVARIVWYNISTGETQFWYMDGHKVVGRGTVLGEDGKPAFIGPPWKIVGIGDMNGNGKADIVWYNSKTGETQIWYMDDHKVVGRGTVLGEDGKSAFIGPPWGIVGAGDMNGNGKADIVWYNSNTGETQVWYMEGNKVVGRGTVLGEDGKPALIGPPWSIVGIGDMNGNGKADIVWYNSNTGETQFWYMDGHKVVGRGTILGEDGKPAFIGPPWRIVGIGDMNRNGKADIVWYNSSTGETQFWYMDGHKVVGRGTVLGEDGKPTFIGPPWSIVGANSEAAIVQIPVVANSIRNFYRRTGGSLGPLGAPVSNIQSRPDGSYVQNYQLGVITLDNPNATPESFTQYGTSVTISAVKCFGTEDPGGVDEPFVIVSLISVNPNFGGTDTLVLTKRTEILENVKAGDVIFERRTIGDVIGFPGSGIRIHVAIFDHEHGDADELRKKINAVLEDVARRGANALAGAAAANDPKLAGAIGDITSFEVGGVKPFSILTAGIADLITDVLADDLIGEYEFFIPAQDIKEWADDPAKYAASLKTSPDLPSRIRYNWPPKAEDEHLFSGGGGSYKIYFNIQGYKIVRSLESKITR